MSPLPQVELSFGASNGAWDDRALITACDAAMAEFHAHHPGPGSWLDKATAAQLAGNPLKDVEETTSSWYTASSSNSKAGPSRQTPTEAERPRKRPRRQETVQPRSDPDQHEGSSTNPYAAAVSYPSRPNRGASPHYAPASPVAQDRSPSLLDNPDYQDFGQTSTTALPLMQPPAPPSVGVSAVDGISEQDATAFAMSSQYWAGYWMGVAQSMRHRRDDGHVKDNVAPAPAAPPAAESRVVVTRRDFGKQPREVLRR